MNNPFFGLTGRVKASVVNAGKVTYEGEWTRNLWLDQGLDQLAETPLCDLFTFAVKGTGTTPTSETVNPTNSYTISNGATTLFRTAGTRDFTSADLGKVARITTAPHQEFTIIAINGVNEVEVTPAASAAESGKDIILYHAQQTALDAEVGRTDTYSATPGENKTTTAGAVRTFQRTFIFDGEDALIENPPKENLYSQSGTTVTRDEGTRDFTIDDEGKTITFRTSGLTAEIITFTDATHVVVGVSQTNSSQAISLSEENEKREDGSGDYSRLGISVSGDGTRPFTLDDVGKIIHFLESDIEATITGISSPVTVTVNSSGPIPPQPIRLYGFTDYTEIGFSHTDETDANLNIRVLLSAPVRVYVSTGLRSSDQLKLTYECKLTISPTVKVSANLATIISDPGNLMSGNKNGDYVIESYATSTIGPDGETDLSFPDLEPYFEGYAAWSLMTDVLEPLGNKVRDTGTDYVGMEAAPYVDGTFTKTLQGLFDLNDAVSNSWRCLMIYDPESKCAIFTFRFDNPQKKDSEHTFTIVFRKSWGRDLS